MEKPNRELDMGWRRDEQQKEWLEAAQKIGQTELGDMELTIEPREIDTVTRPTSDPINPLHYMTKTNFECIDVLEELDLPYHLANVIKYVWRHREKGGVEDLKKARWYLNRYITNVEPVDG